MSNTEIPLLIVFSHVDIACGDVFDRAILEGFGVSLEQRMANPVHALVARDSQLEQHLQAVQVAKAEANLSDETPFCPTLKFASRTFSMLRDSNRRSVYYLIHTLDSL